MGSVGEFWTLGYETHVSTEARLADAEKRAERAETGLVEAEKRTRAAEQEAAGTA